jgi:NTE family protein
MLADAVLRPRRPLESPDETPVAAVVALVCGLAGGRGGVCLPPDRARGAAHVGVLKVLEELRIPISVIAGTSMGALVGGTYAGGISPQRWSAV